jgi:rod shape-determining protein MreD
MRWGVFIVALFACLVLDAGFLNVLEIRGVTPALIPVLAVFVAMSAPRRTALWGCFVIGLLVDLSNRMTVAPDLPFHLIGPNVLGYVAGCHLLLPLRTMVFRRNPLTIGVMTLLFLFIASLVAVAVLLVRSWYPDTEIFWRGDSALGELTARFFTSLYSSLIAIPAGWIFARTAPLWGFHPSAQRSARW